MADTTQKNQGTSMPLPPGVNETDFAVALDEFRRVVGNEWVFSSDADVDLYRDAYSPFLDEPEDPAPLAGKRGSGQGALR